EGIAEAFELRRQHQKYYDESKDECRNKRTAFFDELPALALIVYAVAFRQKLPCLLLQKTDGFSERVSGEWHALQGRGIQLLKGWQAVRLHACRQARDGPKRDERAAAGAHLITGQPIGREPEFPRRLRDYLIAAPFQAETVDIIAAKQRRERSANVSHADPEPVRFVRIDLKVDLRQIEFEIAVGE